MTIKEMMKVHKQINKALNTMVLARDGQINSNRYPDIVEYSIDLVKAYKKVCKIAQALGCEFSDLYVHAYGTFEKFNRWCILNDIDLKDATAAEEDESEQE